MTTIVRFDSLISPNALIEPHSSDCTELRRFSKARSTNGASDGAVKKERERKRKREAEGLGPIAEKEKKGMGAF